MNAPQYAAEIVGTDVPHVDEGRYNATFVGVELTTTKFGAAYKWYWTIPVPGDKPFELTQMTSTATSGGSNGGRVIKALLGRLLAPGEKVSTSLMAGKTAVLDLSVGENGWNRVEDVYPAPSTPAVVQAPAEAQNELPF